MGAAVAPASLCVLAPRLISPTWDFRPRVSSRACLLQARTDGPVSRRGWRPLGSSRTRLPPPAVLWLPPPRPSPHFPFPLQPRITFMGSSRYPPGPDLGEEEPEPVRARKPQSMFDGTNWGEGTWMRAGCVQWAELWAAPGSSGGVPAVPRLSWAWGWRLLRGPFWGAWSGEQGAKSSTGMVSGPVVRTLEYNKHRDFPPSDCGSSKETRRNPTSHWTS